MLTCKIGDDNERSWLFLQRLDLHQSDNESWEEDREDF